MPSWLDAHDFTIVQKFLCLNLKTSGQLQIKQASEVIRALSNNQDLRYKVFQD